MNIQFRFFRFARFDIDFLFHSPIDSSFTYWRWYVEIFYKWKYISVCTAPYQGEPGTLAILHKKICKIKTTPPLWVYRLGQSKYFRGDQN